MLYWQRQLQQTQTPAARNCYKQQCPRLYRKQFLIRKFVPQAPSGSTVARVPLPADLRNATPVNNEDLANRSIILLLRRNAPAHRRQTRKPSKPSATSEEIVAMDGLLGVRRADSALWIMTGLPAPCGCQLCLIATTARFRRTHSAPDCSGAHSGRTGDGPDTLIAALLHDVVEDTEYDENYIETHFELRRRGWFMV